MKASIKFVSIILCVVSVSACSSSKKLPESSEEGTATAEVAAPDAGTDPVPSATAELAPPPVLDGAPPVAEKAAEKVLEKVAEIAAPPAPVAQAPAPVTTPEVITAKDASSDAGPTRYEVRKGDTLMKVAFEVYGDLYRWRELLEANRGVIRDPSQLSAGTVLAVSNPVPHLQISKNGEKYEIKSGDTLGTISKDVYGTTKKWKKLWDNNRELIKDPNKIFAGLFLYFQPETSVSPKPLARDASTADRSTASQ